jgi:hypothetical protein
LAAGKLGFRFSFSGRKREEPEDEQSWAKHGRAVSQAARANSSVP